MANNENINKVVYGDQTLIDLTNDSVTPQTLLEGETAHDRSGAQITGSAVVNTVIEENDSFRLAPTSEGNALARKIYGMSVQDGTPTPSSPVDIDSSSADFKCVGKNLIPYPYYHKKRTNNGITFTPNPDGTVLVEGTATADAWFGIRLRNEYGTDDALYLPNGRYTLSGTPSGGSSSTYYMSIGRGIDQQTAGTWTNEYGSGSTFQVNDDTLYAVNLTMGVKSGTAIPTGGITFKPMIRLATVEDATYEPYKHTDITTSQTLRSIEVTSSDLYNLVKDGKYYIADTIDWDEVDGYTLTKRIEEITLNSSDDWYKAGNTTVNSMGNRSHTSQVMQSISGKMAMCELCEASDNPVITNNSYYQNATNGIMYIPFGAYSESVTVDDFKQAIGNTDYKVLIPLATPTKTSLTSAQAKTLLSMRTYDESTSIDAVNSPAPVVELEYAKNRTSGRALTGHNEGKIDKGYEHISYSEYLQLTPQQIASGKYIVEGSSEAIGIFGKVLTGSLAVGSTTVVLQDSFITTTSMIDVYTDVYGVTPTDVTVATGSITLTFEAQESILNVKVRVM